MEVELGGDFAEASEGAPEDRDEEDEVGEAEAPLLERPSLGFFFLAMMNGRADGGICAGFRRRASLRRCAAKELTFVGENIALFV